MKRSVYTELLAWKNAEDRKPLILEGVRQCGKTYILKEFGNREFESTVYVDLEKRRDLHSIFGDNLEPETIVRNLGIALRRKIIPEKTLLVLDEIQECPRAITSLKYFGEDMPEIHVACAGSLLGVMTHSNSAFPVGKIDRIRMYPMTFSEFLEAEGETELLGYLTSKPVDTPVNPTFHNMLAGYLKEYYVTGGMPEVVNSWINNHDLSSVTRRLRSIVKDYEDDFSKHAMSDLRKLTAIWNSIPEQLGIPAPKFLFSRTMQGGRARELSDAMRWLVDAGLVYLVYQTEKPSDPLKTCADSSRFKAYMCDTGILRVMAGKGLRSAEDFSDKIFKGSFTENFVLCQMFAGGLRDAFTWKSGNYEVDFLVDGDRGAIPIEVKPETDRRHRSLEVYREKFSPEISVITSMSPSAGGEIIRIPLYCAEFIPSYFCKEHREVRYTDSRKPFRRLNRESPLGSYSGQTSIPSFCTLRREQYPLDQKEHASQQPGRYLPHPPSGETGLDSGRHTHMSPEWVQSLHVRHFP